MDRFFSHRAHRVHGVFWRTFRAHRTPPAYRVHRAFQLILDVRFCEIGWLNVSVECCVFCSSVFLCEKKINCETRWGGFSLTELTDLTEPFSALFRSHRTPPAYRYHRTLLLTWVERFCEFCMPEAFCEIETVRKKGLSNLWDLWEKKLPSKPHRHYLIEWVRSISHRITQMNRTHSIQSK